MTKTVKFSEIGRGESFKSSGRPDGDTFKKEADENREGEGGCDKCGKIEPWNALNVSDKNGEFFVHFCSDADVLIEVSDIDVSVTHHGSICMISALTEAAQDWIRKHVILEDWQLLGAGMTFACEPRYVEDLVAGMTNGGLEVVV